MRGCIGGLGRILRRGIAGSRGRRRLGGGGLRDVRGGGRVEPGNGVGVRAHVGRPRRRDDVRRRRGRRVGERGDRRELRRECVVRPCRRGGDRRDRGEERQGGRANEGRAIEVPAHLEMIYALRLTFSFTNYVGVLFTTM